MLLLIDTREEPRRREPRRLPRWLAVLVLLLVLALAFGGVIGVILLFTAICLAVDRLLPSAEWSGLRHHRQ